MFGPLWFILCIQFFAIGLLWGKLLGKRITRNTTLEEIAEMCEERAEEHDQGAMMSLAEAIHGAANYREVAKIVRQMKEN